ncbi:hypothetical protein JY97_09455 [Alkalispirochaeta odontotermitis]|nr:hypothetical protein JY97_09455 [Alkalispirochaeta odontotermitis]CAB1075882.1 hypothetical protein D1AOALGA4SA_3690 [Olavius algarvensis Delta 1 endosymbiont]
MKGILEKRLLLETLLLLGSGKKTGVLHLTDSSQEIKIYVDQGAVIFVTGSIPEARLEHLLIHKKLFPAERIKDLLLISKKENQPIIQLLVSKKLATITALEKLMAIHVRHVISKALSWANGTYEFKPARIDGRLAASIKYDCRRLVRDISGGAEGPTATKKTSEDESSQIYGPKLKKAILKKMNELPSAMKAVIKAKKLLASEDASFEALHRILETDQSMVAMILKVANSAYYGMSGKISSLKHAISMLGLQTLSQIITLAGTGNFLNQPLKGYGYSTQELRSHSLAVGFGARHLAMLVSPALEDDAFIAGLLHDAGKIMLDPYVAEREVLPKAGVNDAISEIEKRLLGCDHSEIAAEVFDQWLFPANVIDGIRFHHSPDQSDDHEVAYILNVADVLAKVGQNDIPIYEISSVIDKNVSDFLGIEQEDIAAIFNETKESEKNID